ncbi:MAG: hypothetical protein IAE81_16145 [Caldilineaceae bacterium]|nr:hypothetical protein [Caldilineaceae bacterium]
MSTRLAASTSSYIAALYDILVFTSTNQPDLSLSPVAQYKSNALARLSNLPQEWDPASLTKGIEK